MTGAQRRMHVRVWIVLGAISAAGFAAALVIQPPALPAAGARP